jgi:hypothetical protein
MKNNLDFLTKWYRNFNGENKWKIKYV